MLDEYCCQGTFSTETVGRTTALVDNPDDIHEVLSYLIYLRLHELLPSIFWLPLFSTFFLPPYLL